MSAGGWTTFRIRNPGDRGAVVRVLFAAGAEGVQELDSEVVTSFRRPDVGAITAAIAAADRLATVETEPTPDIDWSAAWKDRIGAHELGALVVTPPWLADRHARESSVIIDPGMAFGTGEHETTRGVIRLMQGIVRRGDVVADLGAGSAVLAIAAAKLGASRAIAIELDPDAIGNAEENVERNGVSGIVSVIEGDAESLLPLVAPVRVVFANIISSVLVTLLPTIREALTSDGRAILSGILLDERPLIERALSEGEWKVEAEDAEGLWWSVAISPA
ncbi:MAG TPA: 50S ribosomal protein L11 methyltransferase [Gemmatimonadaceae bacterium]|nr:50S ribosomal protein L11 methyltransferase [Gemmatimonadaceae bacterium]